MTAIGLALVLGAVVAAFAEATSNVCWPRWLHGGMALAFGLGWVLMVTGVLVWLWQVMP